MHVYMYRDTYHMNVVYGRGSTRAGVLGGKTRGGPMTKTTRGEASREASPLDLDRPSGLVGSSRVGFYLGGIVSIPSVTNKQDLINQPIHNKHWIMS